MQLSVPGKMAIQMTSAEVSRGEGDTYCPTDGGCHTMQRALEVDSRKFVHRRRKVGLRDLQY